MVTSVLHSVLTFAHFFHTNSGNLTNRVLKHFCKLYSLMRTVAHLAVFFGGTFAEGWGDDEKRGGVKRNLETEMGKTKIETNMGTRLRCGF